MLAILAFVCFVLATFHVNLAGLELVALGLAFLSLHFVVPVAWTPWRRGPNG